MQSAKVLIFAIVLGISFSLATQNAAAQDATRFEIVAADGEVLGQSESMTRERPGGGYDVVTRREYLLREEEGRKTKVVHENIVSNTPEGKVLSIQNNYSVGRRKSQTLAIIDGQTATIRRNVKNDVREVALALPDDIRFDNGAGLLKNSNLTDGKELTFHILDINAPAINRVSIQEIENIDGDGRRKFLRRTYRNNSLYGVSELILENSGNLLKSERKLFGSSISHRRFEDGAAKPKLSSSSIVEQVMVKSPVRFPRSARNGKIRYRFKFPDEIRFSPPTTGEQNVTENADGFTLDICEGCGGGLSTDPAYLESALEAGFWLQSDHEKILRFSKYIGGKSISEAEKMNRIARKGREYSNELDYAGHFSALEALEKRSGDCTESAVLLAALGRSMGIPTRVVSGLVYSRERYHGVSHSFMPHSWTIAYVDGSWQSFDMALDGFDSTHIAFNISDGDPASIAAGHQLPGLLEWAGVSEVRKRDK